MSATTLSGSDCCICTSTSAAANRVSEFPCSSAPTGGPAPRPRPCRPARHQPKAARKTATSASAAGSPISARTERSSRCARHRTQLHARLDQQLHPVRSGPTPAPPHPCSSHRAVGGLQGLCSAPGPRLCPAGRRPPDGGRPDLHKDSIRPIRCAKQADQSIDCRPADRGEKRPQRPVSRSSP